MSFVVPGQKASHIEMVDSSGNVGRIFFDSGRFYLQSLNESDEWIGAELVIDAKVTYTRVITLSDLTSKGDIFAGKRMNENTPNQ
jgi:hypothetical protein